MSFLGRGRWRSAISAAHSCKSAWSICSIVLTEVTASLHLLTEFLAFDPLCDGHACESVPATVWSGQLPHSGDRHKMDQFEENASIVSLYWVRNRSAVCFTCYRVLSRFPLSSPDLTRIPQKPEKCNDTVRARSSRFPKWEGFIIVMSGAQPIMCLLLPVKRIHSQD